MTEDGTPTNSPPIEPKPMDAAPSSEAGAHVFISYASADTAVADKVCAALERAGVRCWIAPRDVMPGALYADAIVRAISSASAILLILSESAVVSPHVGKEIERGSSKRRPILALRVDAAPLTPALEYFLSESQWIDARSGDLDALLPRLKEAVRHLVASPVAVPPPSGEKNTDRWALPQTQPVPPVQAGALRPVLAPAALHTNRIFIAAMAIFGIGLAYVLIDKFWLSRHASREVPTTQAASATPAAPPAATVISDDSIAVLPFTDMSEKKDQEYFSDGLSEELIDLLTKIPQLHVPARTSSFYFKGKSEDIPTIARKLLVAHVLEGSVRKSGNHLRVTAQLIRADNGYHLWSETYDRQLDDIFKVQDEIATAVVGALKLKLLAAPTEKEHQTASPEAYNQYLIGRHLLSGSNWAVDRSAAEAFQRAVDLDPNYAPAWAGLAEATAEAAEDTIAVAELTAKRQKALTAADKAIALRPDLADGYVARGSIRAWDQWDFRGAGEDFRQALALDPENSNVLAKYVRSVLLPTGRLDEGVAAAEKVVKADPLNSSSWRELGIMRTFRGDYGGAREALERSLEINPEQSNTAAFLAYAMLLQGDPAGALPVARRSTVELFQLQVAALADHDLGHTQEAQQHLDEAIAKDATNGAYQIAEVYAWWGDKDRAFQWLDRAYVQRDGGLTIVEFDPLVRSLRPDPRFAALLKKLIRQD
jgi:TolB-like protein/thioredoxin-like negative regulator of GroEL